MEVYCIISQSVITLTVTHDACFAVPLYARRFFFFLLHHKWGNMPKYFGESSWHLPVLKFNNCRPSRPTDPLRRSHYTFPSFVFIQMLSIFKNFTFNLGPVLFCTFCFTSMPRSLFFCLRHLPPRFQCTSTTMAQLLELFFISFITKFMFTSSVLCSSFASVKHFTAVCIIYLIV